MNCNYCSSNQVIRHGKTSAGTQRYKCKTCKRRFVTDSIIDERAKTNSRAAQALRESGMSYREIGAEMGINHQTAVNLQIDDPCVYIVKIGGLYKIGKTRNINQRIAALKSEHGYPCELIAQRSCDHNAVEKKMHELFKEWHVGSELFRFEQGTINFAKWMLQRV